MSGFNQSPAGAKPLLPPAFAHDRLCLPLSFDVARMEADLAALPAEGWIEHFVKQNYEGDWSVLPLRCKKGATHPIMMAVSDPNATEFVDTPWAAYAPYLLEILTQFACPLHSVRLMRLAPHSHIKPHTDLDLAAEWGKARLHIPITTNPDVDFRLNGARLSLAPGSTWYLRLADVHEIYNRGANTRVHLVIDCLVNDWLLDMLNAAARQADQLAG